jgi:4-hydroxymandelate oxidase
VFAGVAVRDLSTTVLGQRVAMPVTVAPMGFQRMAHPDGECATARAAGDAGVVMVASTMANASIEEIVAAATGPVWFQLYVYKDRGVTRALVERAEAAGCTALQVTADVPVLGNREADVRNRFTLPPGLTIANVEPYRMGRLPSALADSGTAVYAAELLDDSLTWDAFGWLRSLTRLPVLVKGVVRGDDAARAIECGAAGVVVSNHGGRQLDGAPAAIDVLEEVVQAVAGRGEVLLDGGVRRGTDVVKALALGAKAVQLGRPVLWGLSAGGVEGVRRVLEILRAEFDRAMALCGCPAVARITRELVARA